MIFINTNNKFAVNHKNFPHLFEFDEITGEYYQISDFFWDYDNDYNLLIETTITDKNELQKAIKDLLFRRKKLVLDGIANFNRELEAINTLLLEEEDA